MTKRFSMERFDPQVSLCKFEDHWSLCLLGLWVQLGKVKTPPKDMMDSYGVHLADDAFVIRTGNKDWIYWHWPWSWDNCEHKVWMKGMFWETWNHTEEFRERVYTEKHPYAYVLKSGEVQQRTAIVNFECWAWYWRICRYLPWLKKVLPAKVSECIDVEFSDEVGERSGSWKGGCIGCSYELKYNSMGRRESLESCLRRMERERVFN